MITTLPRRLRLRASHSEVDAPTPVPDADRRVAFVAYGEDCVIRGDAVLGADRLTDMLNDHDDYLLNRVTVDSFVDDSTLAVAEVVIPRDEILLVHAMGPRGVVARRHHTTPHLLAFRLGPYEVLGFFHALPGADPVAALGRRKSMVPITDALISYTFRGARLERRVETLILNRARIDWVGRVAEDEVEMPELPVAANTGRLLKDLTGHLFEIRGVSAGLARDEPEPLASLKIEDSASP